MTAKSLEIFSTCNLIQNRLEASQIFCGEPSSPIFCCNLPGSLLETSCLTNMPETLAGIGPEIFPREGKLTPTNHIFEEGISGMFGNRKFQIDSKNMKKT